MVCPNGYSNYTMVYYGRTPPFLTKIPNESPCPKAPEEPPWLPEERSARHPGERNGTEV